MSRAEDAVQNALLSTHASICRVAGQISIVLVRRRTNARLLLAYASHLRSAADVLTACAERMAETRDNIEEKRRE